MTATPHPAAVPHLPPFITAPGGSDWLMVATTISTLCIVVVIGNFYFKLHSLPERKMHKPEKFQFEVVAILGLLSLFTHNHLFWVAGLLLAFVDLPDFTTPLKRMAGSLEKISGIEPDLADPEYRRLHDADGAHAPGHSAHKTKHGA